MACKCGSERIAKIVAKCNDLCNVELNNQEHDGYVPRDMQIGGGDYIRISLCLDCGKVQGDFPLPETGLEQIGDQE